MPTESPIRIVQADTGEVRDIRVRHELPLWGLLALAIMALGMGVLSGKVWSQESTIRKLQDDVSLALVWAQTHHHPIPGEQPTMPEENTE